MAFYYKHIYTALRSSMIDRDMGDKLEEDGVLIDFKSAQVALKKEIPSAALLISYSMLFYPNWLASGDPEQNLAPAGKPIEDFIGGVENPFFPLLFNIHMGMIALAVGCYAGILQAYYNPVLGTIIVNPVFDHPLVLETRRQIIENQLDFSHARDVFIQLMQQEEYAVNIPLADDYIANATWIPEKTVSIETDANEYIQNSLKVDPKVFKEVFLNG